MIKSMTGFGRSEYSDGARNAIVEIRTVNHRYSDFSIRMSRKYSFAEDKIKKELKKYISRGKTDVSIVIENLTEEDAVVKLNTMMAEQYVENLKKLKESYSLEGDITLEFVAGLPDVLKAVPDVEDEEKILSLLLKAVDLAAEKLDEMRCIEGSKLSEDILMRGGLIRDKVNEIKKFAPEVVENYTARLNERMTELLEKSSTIPEDRILAEAAIFADKSNITEEIVRLDSHIIQLNKIIKESTQPDGKKLDFLVQEMNREANTIGSKANNLDITNCVLTIKSEIEKIREQVQNIE